MRVFTSTAKEELVQLKGLLEATDSKYNSSASATPKDNFFTVVFGIESAS
jgi:hypothetical protein